ncbi:unnamed protein product [Bursaphelenchus okinawaensis]|uniref:Uncharacterized protein n=1 Tax=Bursaphelenchus okinawaensis TaxID=465554 RepID=A0A811KA61_9BILA|nr:unnamed protein product [Bursaphelenchus okinawaensis]CAG9098492.1 unnamed protein product [Bursaphelenchus okinawaensis]
MDEDLNLDEITSTKSTNSTTAMPMLPNLIFKNETVKELRRLLESDSFRNLYPGDSKANDAKMVHFEIQNETVVRTDISSLKTMAKESTSIQPIRDKKMVPFEPRDSADNIYILINRKLFLLTNFQRLITVTNTSVFNTSFDLRYTVVGMSGDAKDYRYTSRPDLQRDLLYATHKDACFVGAPSGGVALMKRCTKNDIELKYDGWHETHYYSLEHLIALSNQETALNPTFTRNTYVKLVDSNAKLWFIIMSFFGGVLSLIIVGVLVPACYYVFTNKEKHRKYLYKHTKRL